MNENPKTLISFVIPIFNEEQSVEILYSRICKAIEPIGVTLELVYVDDHSSDSTLSLLRSLREKDHRVKVIAFSRNFGHQIAVTAGLQHASGDCVVIMDGDLQDPPEVALEMIKKWREGFDVVYGIRRHRKEIFLKRVCYNMFYWLLNKITPLQIPRDAGDFCLLDKRVAAQMRRFSEERPFVRGLRNWVGFKQTGIEYDRPAREVGSTKYSIMNLVALAFDGMLSFSNIALRVAAAFGFILSFVSIIYAGYIAITRMLIAFGIIKASGLIPGWATLICAILFLMGIQFIFLGIIGEYIGRIFLQVKQRPLYIVQEKMGFGDDQ